MPLVPELPADFYDQFAAWVRLEPRCRSDDFARGLQARVADPLWMLARQWQTGELRGEDAGSPIDVQLLHSTQSLDLIRAGTAGAIEPLPEGPLEIAIEQEYLQLDWRVRVQVGQRFERLIRGVRAWTDPAELELTLAEYRDHYPIDLPQGNDLVQLDESTKYFIEFVERRAVDGLGLIGDMDFSDQNQHDVPVLGGVSSAELDSIIITLKSWCSVMCVRTEPVTPEAWRSMQLDYRFELNPPEAADDDGKCHLIAPDYRSGDLDWYTLETVSDVGTDWTAKPELRPLPTRISVAGTSPRWWAFEDAKTDFGTLDTTKPDLTKLLLMEFVLVHGDDWYSVPLTVRAPRLVRIDALKVYNVFGEELTINSARSTVREAISLNGGDPDDPLLRWDMYTLSPYQTGDVAASGIGDVLFLPSTIGFRQESRPLEEVRLLRDEGANMVWGVEHIVLDGLGKPVRGFDSQRNRLERVRQAEIERLSAELAVLEQQLAQDGLSDQLRESLEAQAEDLRATIRGIELGFQPSGDAPSYRMATTVPENWIPFLPASARPFFGLTYPSVRLRRAYMLRNTADEEPAPIPAMSRLLSLAGDEPLMWIEESAVPRSGLRLQLTYQRARWVDGRTYLWLGRKVLTGRGEGASGLMFDVLVQ